jgi:hypothetical protein
MTRTVTGELVRSGHLVRSLRLAPFAPGAVAVVALLIARRGGTPDPVADLRTLGLLLALGSGYVLDDGAASTLAASPTGLARRHWLRIGVAAAIVAPLWTVALIRLLLSAPAGERWTVGLGLTVELAAAIAVVLAIAALGRRLGFDQPGIFTTPALLAAVLLLATLTSRAPMLVGPGPQWTGTHLRWAGILIGATGLLLAAVRDPAARWRRPG